MTRLRASLAVLVLMLAASSSVAQTAAERAVFEALRGVYGLRNYTAFDWISARYLKGTLTLQGFARTAQLKEQAAAAARKAPGIDDVVNEIEVLPTHQGDDDIRVRAYVAIYASSALERYAPGGQLSGAAVNELLDAGRLGLDAADVGRGPHAIHIIVNGSRVLLLGEVKVTGDRRIAEAALRTLPGVLSVNNQLRVAGQK
jgi:hyperosmotically inducible periplasmic protein